jgi:hypothetical protein
MRGANARCGSREGADVGGVEEADARGKVENDASSYCLLFILFRRRDI